MNTTHSKKNPLLKAFHISERLDLPLSSIYELVRQNKIPGIVRIGKSIRFDPDIIETWIAQGGHKDEQIS